MKYVAIVIALLIVVVVFVLLALARKSKSGKAAGLSAGQLHQCPASPNCVCSENAEDAAHYVKPIAVPAGTAAAEDLNMLKDIAKELGGIIQTDTGEYVAIAFSSNLFGFVDDLELRLDRGRNVIHIRSAARVGHSDFGANRKRVELIRALYNKKFQQE